MAHQTEIVINGVTTEVTEFDHTAQEIDDGIDNLHTLTGGATTPQGALANLGAGVRPNIADNGNLIDAVNQRQFVSTTQSGRILDRWEISSDATINVTYTKGSGLLLQNLGSAGNLFLTQKRERKLEEEKKYTLSVLTDKGLFSDSLSPGESSYPTSGLYFSVVNRSGYGEFDIGVLAGGNSFLVKYVKVEDGEGQTLAYQDSTGAWQLLPQPESDYATQLAKCQRYYYRSDMRYSAKPVYNNRYLHIPVQFPVVMRISPTVTVKSFAGTVNMLSAWDSGLDAEISVSANASDVSKDGIGSFFTESDMNMNAVYGFCIEASADL